MNLSIRKIPLIFKEEKLSAKEGLSPIPTSPSYTTVPSTDVDLVCFPYVISNTIMSDRFKSIRVRKIKQEHPYLDPRDAADLLFEYIPSRITTKYRRYLRKKIPSIATKPLILILITDRDPPYSVPDDVFCVRTSLYKSSQRKYDLSFPFILEWSEYKGALFPSKPSIGFCGVPHNHALRQSLLAFLQDSSLIKTDFVFRERFFGFLNLNIEEKKTLREEFTAILHRNIFSVSCRGAGNYSKRFYETLRAGRIPVLLDSDMSLPFEDEINWNEIIICKKTTHEVEQTILDWIANRDLVAIQNQCRKIWEEYLYFPKTIERLPAQFGKFIHDGKD